LTFKPKRFHLPAQLVADWGILNVYVLHAGAQVITEKKQQIEVCPTCGGRKEILCEICQGTGENPSV
jgi:hypothetical protein